MADNDAAPRTIEEREARITQIDTRLAELDAEFDNTVMTDEARDEWNLLNQERDQHATAAAELRRRKERMRQLVASGSVERAQGPAFVPTHSDDIYDLHRIRVASHTDEDYRSRLRDNALRAVERGAYPAGPTKERQQAHIESLIARCDDKSGTLSKLILTTGSPAYERAFGKVITGREHMLTTEERAAQSLSDSNGGLAVPYQLDPTVVLTGDGTVSAIRQISRVEQITSKEWQGITSAGITVSRSSEAAANTGNNFTITQPTVSPTRVTAYVPFSIEIDQDWSQLRSEIARLLAVAKQEEEDESFVTGNGTPPNPNGIAATLNSSSEVNPSGASFAIADLDTLEGDLGPRFRARASYLGNKAVYQKVRALARAESAMAGDRWVSATADTPAMLNGYNVYEASAMSSDMSTAASRFLLFGDFSQFLIVDRLGMTVELIPHVVDGSGNPTGQRGIFAVWRNNSKVLVDNAFRVLTVADAS